MQINSIKRHPKEYSEAMKKLSNMISHDVGTKLDASLNCMTEINRRKNNVYHCTPILIVDDNSFNILAARSLIFKRLAIESDCVRQCS
jgi:hypothetical protein